MRAILTIAVAVAVLAACSGTGEDDTSTTSTTTTAPSDPPEPEEEEEADSTTTTATATAVAGTRESPIPAGEAAQVGDYLVTVISYEGDATQAVLDENEFNEPPPDGDVFSLISLNVEYVGDDSGDPFFELFWSGVGDSNVSSEPDDCNTYPNSMIDAGELFPGGAVEANICLTVPLDDVGSLILILEEFTSGRLFFALP